MKLGEFFETKQRDSGESFVTMREGYPTWLQIAIREAHSGDMPNDWIYEECRAACEAIDAGDLRDDDAVHEYADGRVDVYTQELYRWAADMCLSDTYAQAEGERADAGFETQETEIHRTIAQLQYFAIRRIAQAMVDAWSKRREGAARATVSP